MDAWMPFLEARMKLIKEARREGRDLHKIHTLINTDMTQTIMLVNRAIKEIANERTTDEVSVPPL